MKKILLVFNLILLVHFASSYELYAKPSSKSIMVISTISMSENDPKGLICPEILIGQDGIWREATTKDIFIGQKFNLFQNETKHGRLKDISREIFVNAVKTPFGEFSNNTKQSGLFFGIYKNINKYKIISKEKSINSKKIENELQKKFKQQNLDFSFIEQIVQLDIGNIRKDFSADLKSDVKKVISGDLNGDNKKDYILIVGETSFGNENSKAAAVIGYVSLNEKYVRFPLMYWECTNEETGWPKLLFIHDFNGDNKGELFITDSDSDTSRPIVFSWFQNVIKVIYHAQRELWNG